MYDIRTGKERPVVPAYIERRRKCLDRIEEIDNPCDCKLCKDKRILAKKLLTISKWLCVDYNSRTGNQLCNGDWFEVVVMTADNLKEVIYPKV